MTLFKSLRTTKSSGDTYKATCKTPSRSVNNLRYFFRRFVARNELTSRNGAEPYSDTTGEGHNANSILK